MGQPLPASLGCIVWQSADSQSVPYHGHTGEAPRERAGEGHSMGLRGGGRTCMQQIRASEELSIAAVDGLGDW